MTCHAAAATAAAAAAKYSVLPHRWQPTRLPLPWDSPGKNTGVGCHFLLQCMKVKSESEFAQSCRTLSDPMDCSLPGSSIPGIFQARVLEWGAIAFSILRYMFHYFSILTLLYSWTVCSLVSELIWDLPHLHFTYEIILRNIEQVLSVLYIKYFVYPDSIPTPPLAFLVVYLIICFLNLSLIDWIVSSQNSYIVYCILSFSSSVCNYCI